MKLKPLVMTLLGLLTICGYFAASEADYQMAVSEPQWLADQITAYEQQQEELSRRGK